MRKNAKLPKVLGGKIQKRRKEMELTQEELGDKVGEGDLLTSLGNVYGNMGDYDQAINHFSAALQIFSSLGLEDRLEYLQNNLTLAQGYRSGRA